MMPRNGQHGIMRKRKMNSAHKIFMAELPTKFWR